MNKSCRFERYEIKELATLDFDDLISLCESQSIMLAKSLFKEIHRKETTKKDYSCREFRRTRLLSLNVQDVMKVFRDRSLEYHEWKKEKNRKKNENKTQTRRNNLPTAKKA
jgi:hypothetical protein